MASAASLDPAASELLAAVVSDDFDTVRELGHQKCLPTEVWWRALELADQRAGAKARTISKFVHNYLKRGIIPRPTGASEIVKQVADFLQPTKLSPEKRDIRDSKVAEALGLLLQALTPATNVVSPEVYQQKVDDLAARILAGQGHAESQHG